MLRDHAHELIYEDITGNKNGLDRVLTDINGLPALMVRSRYDFYYTLLIHNGKILIDCAYFDARNNNNGARASAGVCGLNRELDNRYDEIAQNYLNDLRSSIFSFDTQSIINNGTGSDFLLGKIGEIEIFDRYSSVSSLENSSPQKVVKNRHGCFNFETSTGFLVFMNKDNLRLEYFDVLHAEEPMKLQRMQEQDLKKLAVGKCDP